MNFEIDGSQILYGIGGLLGAASILFFAFNTLFSFSPLTKSTILLLGAAAFLILAQRTHDLLELCIYSLTGLTYLAFVSYTSSAFNPSRALIFGLLTVSALLFTFLGYLSNKGELRLESHQVRNLLAVIIILGFGLSVFDVTGSQPSYSLSLDQQVNLTKGEELVIGSVVVQNSFPLPRKVDIADYEACSYIEGQKIDVYIESPTEKLISGNDVRQVDLILHVQASKNISLPPSMPVKQAEKCTPSEAENSLVIYEREERY